MTTLSEILKQSPNVGLSIEFCHDLIEDDECNQDGKISEHLAMFSMDMRCQTQIPCFIMMSKQLPDMIKAMTPIKC